MRPDQVRCISLSVADVTPKTRWIFVEIETELGCKGTGEATLNGREQSVMEALARFSSLAFALPEADPERLVRPALTGLESAAAFSALDQALWDVAAQRRHLSLAAALGTVRRDRIPLYANINRRTLKRSPADFAAIARDALAAGHEAIKIAPFDEVTASVRHSGAARTITASGLARARAVRDAIGPARRLMIDCHWRLDEAAAEQVIDAAAEIGTHWVECPLPETPANLEALVRLRARANRAGVLLAGCEQEIGIAGFEPFLRAGAYDVMMPDAKYVGGLGEMLRLAERMQRDGVAFSPHNPSGPICHAVSLHLCAGVSKLHSLETQFDETPWFDALAGQKLQQVVAGTASLPAGPGLGVTLQPAVLERRRSMLWQADRQAAVTRMAEGSHG